jgi:lipopolysaccharide transport system ATP-binding protein
MVARLGFSVVVHLDPEILLIAEILAVGYAHFQTKCHERLDELASRRLDDVEMEQMLTTSMREPPLRVLLRKRLGRLWS